MSSQIVTPIFFVAEHQRRHAPRRFEIAIFVEDVVSRQKRFVRFRDRRAWLQQSGRIMKRLSASLVSIDETDEQTGATTRRLESSPGSRDFAERTAI